MATLQPFPVWRLRSVGGPAGWQRDTRQRLLASFERGFGRPERYVLHDEDGAQPFDEAAVLAPRDGPAPGGLLLERDGAEAWLDLGPRPALELRLGVSAQDDVTAWADEWFGEVPPDAAWLAPWSPAIPPEAAAWLDELHRATGAGQDWLRDGPIGPGIVTWLGPSAPAGLREAMAALAELRASAPRPGLLRLDLAHDDPALPWATRLARWHQAREACRSTGWFARADPQARSGFCAGPQWPAPTARKPPAQWQGLRMQDRSFIGADLAGADLRDTVLVDCDFDRAKLGAARLDCGDFDQVRWRDAVAPGASFAGATLVHCFLQRMQLEGARLEGAILRGCHAPGLRAAGAQFDRALLEDVDLARADLRGASFRGALLRRCALDGADVREIDWEGARLESCTTRGARGDIPPA